jgi:hypothetical protein
VSPSPTTARRVWRDSDYLREENLAHGSRDPDSVTKRLGPLDRGRAMPGTDGPGIATYLSKKMYHCVVRAQRTGW